MTPLRTSLPRPLRSGAARPVTMLMWLCLMLLPASSAGAEERTETVELEARRLADALSGTQNPAVALAHVQALEQLRPYMSQARYAELTEEAARRVPSPLARVALERHAARARLELGDLRNGHDGMKGPLGQAGCMTDWLLAGPFENASMQGFHTALGPETGEAGPYAGKTAEVDWRGVSDAHNFCVYNLSNVARPVTAAVVYMASRVESPRARKATLLVGAQGAYRVWVNGRLVGERDDDRGFGLDNDAWDVDLARGQNDVLVKLGSTGQGGLTLSARLVDRARLEPLTDLTARAEWSGKAVETNPNARSNTLRPNDGGVLATIARTTAAAAGADATLAQRADAARAAWLWHLQQPGDTATPWRDVANSLLASFDARTPGAPSPGNTSPGNTSPQLEPRTIARLAELYGDHWRRLALLERAHAIAPTDPWITVALAGELGAGMSEQQEFRRRSLLEHLVEDHPRFLPGRIQLADWFARNDLASVALELLLGDGDAERTETLAYVRRVADWTEQVRSEEEARGHRDQVMRLSRLSGLFLWRHVKDLSATGNYDDALERVREQRTLQPFSLQWGLQEVHLLRARGQDEEALAVLDALVERVPGESQLLEQRAQLLMALDRWDEAIETVERALVLRPQEQDLHELLAFLRPDADRFYEPWMVDDPTALAAANRPGRFNYDTIVDQSIVRVAPNGLAQNAVQRVDRVITPEGVDTARRRSISYRIGDERVEVLRVRVYKQDGSISEDFDQWRSGSSRKRSTTYNDTAYVNVRANNVEVGDLVEFRYVVHQIANENFRGDYFGDVSFVQGPRPIALARYTVLYPETWELHFRPPVHEHTRTDGTLPDGRPVEEGRATAFELTNVPRVLTDNDQPGFTEVYDHILVSNKKTYDEIGRWWWNLVREQLVVDDDIRQTVATLTAGLTSDEQKVRAIYNYVARNTRYLHVGLGIHGWKPYRTTDIMRNRYGDCKDKAALLKVMLETAGIETHLVLVRTRRLGDVDSYPASMHIFNHAVAYVPSLDLFLDATAEFNGAHELTSMDQGAQALIVRDGGTTRWLKLPVDRPEQNLLRQTLEVDLTGAEPLIHGKLVAYGANAVYYRQSLEDPERRDEILERQLAGTFPGARLQSASYAHLDDLDRPAEITFTIAGGRVLHESDARRFVYPYGSPRDLLASYARQATRNQPLTIRVPFANEMTIRYRLPAGQAIERVPRDTTLETRFGKLAIAYAPQADGLVVDVHYSLGVQRVEVEDYAEFRKFVAEMTAALNETLGLTGE